MKNRRGINVNQQFSRKKFQAYAVVVAFPDGILYNVQNL